MKFNLIYPIKEHYCDPNLIAPVARVADESGFDLFLVWDHYTLPSGPETLDAHSLILEMPIKHLRGVENAIR